MPFDLITLAEYKTYTGINSTTQDTQINHLIPVVSEFAKTFCGRKFNNYVDDPNTEVLNGGYAKLLMQEYPLIGVNCLEYSADYGQTYTELVEYTDYVVDMEDSSIQVIGADVFPKLINGYRVTYRAGFDPIPEDLKIAVMDLLTYYIRSDMAVKSQRSVGSSTVQVEYITKNTLPAHIARVFDIYTAAWD